MSYRNLLAIAVSTAFLAGCGGGGGDGSTPATSPVTSTLAFPLQAAYKSFAASGFSKTFSISGTCTGSGNASVSAANVPTTFEGTTGFSATSTITGTFANCTPGSYAGSSTSYYDTNYTPLGSSTAGTSYGVYATPLSIPVTVKVGDTATVGTETKYTNSTKTTPSGTNVMSYIVEVDTANTAIVNLISKSYNALGTLTSTGQDRYRITSGGTLTPTSMDIQYANGSTTHLIFTFN